MEAENVSRSIFSTKISCFHPDKRIWTAIFLIHIVVGEFPSFDYRIHFNPFHHGLFTPVFRLKN